MVQSSDQLFKSCREQDIPGEPFLRIPDNCSGDDPLYDQGCQTLCDYSIKSSSFTLPFTLHIMVQEITLELIKEQIRTIPDFPKAGILFKDITTVLKQPEYFGFIIDEISASFRNRNITKVVCIESRGFILGGAIAAAIGAGFVPIRKPGKLPARTIAKNYTLEYGSNTIEIHTDSLTSSDIVLLHDDLLATGGTARAAIDLIRVLNPKKIFLSFFCELGYLHGRKVLEGYDINSLIHF